MLAKYSRSSVVIVLVYVSVIVISTPGPGDNLWSWTSDSIYPNLLISLPGLTGLLVKRTKPKYSLALICVSAVLSLAVGSVVPAMMFLFDSSYSFAERLALSHRRSLLIGASVITALACTCAFISGNIPFATTMLFIIGVSVWLPLFWGLDIVSAHQLAHAERERALSSMQSLADRAELALAEERVCMAAELHDTVSSRLAAIALQAQAARTLLKGERETEIIKQIHSEAIQALGDMKVQIALLSGASPLTVNEADFNELSQLVDRSKALGQSVELDGPELEGLSQPSSQVLYKIVHEALLNAAKHAPGEKVEVRWTVNDSSVQLDVINRLPDKFWDLSGSAPLCEPSPGIPGTGLGLSSLERRVLAFGGAWFAGPSGQRWCIEAKIPHPLPWSSHTSATPHIKLNRERPV